MLVRDRRSGRRRCAPATARRSRRAAVDRKRSRCGSRPASSARSRGSRRRRREPVVDQRLDVDLPGEPAVDQHGHLVAAFTPPNDEPATRRPVIRNRGTMSSVSPLPATPATVQKAQPMRADSTYRITRVAGRLEGSRRRSRRWTRRSSPRPRRRSARSRRGGASSSRSSERSTQAIRPAPARRQPITAPGDQAAPGRRVDPGSTFAVLSAAPIPVEEGRRRRAQRHRAAG